MRDDAGVAYGFLRTILFRLEPERAHALSLALLRVVGALPPLRWAVSGRLAPRAGRPVEAFGLRFSNAVGLAAGYDKDGLAWRGLAALGFGHVELGTVTPLPQPGNPRPRLFRLAAERSLINRLGFPSRGADFVARRLAGRGPGGPVVGVNLGKQRGTPLERAADDYAALMDRFAPLADYLAVNVSSPNTPGLRRLQEREWLAPLLSRLTGRRAELSARLGRPVPLLLKLSPDLAEAELDSLVETIAAAGVDGVIATNTTTSRAGLADPTGSEPGGLSGAALAERSTRFVGAVSRRAGGRFAIVACGGVMGPEDARAKLAAGAALVQVYTGLVFEGPGLVRRIVGGLGP